MVIPREKNRNKNHLWRRETLYKSNATTFRRRRRRRRRRKETRRRRHERVGRESVKARRTVEDPRGTTTTTTTTRELHRETGDVGVFLFLVGAWSFFIGENRSAAAERRRKGVVLVVVVQPSSISSSVEHTQSLTQNNTDPMYFTQTGVETPGRRGHRLRAANADNSREKRWIERHHRG